MTGLGDEYAARAADFRRLAETLGNEKERAALLAIADQYEAVAAQLDADGSPPGVPRSPDSRSG